MVNTVTQKTLFGDSASRKIIRSVHIASDGTEETNLVVYNNSDFINDTSTGRLNKVWVMGSFTGAVLLSWDQTADESIISVGSGDGFFDFTDFGGYRNPNAAGATGDIFLTSRALAALDDLTIIMEIQQS